MKIHTIRIKNFRCYPENESDQWGVEFRPNPDLNLLIGPNGAGKTALLDAIDLVMNVEGRTNQSLISEYDFPACDTSKKICIEIVLTDIDQTLSQFDSDIQWIDNSDGEPIENKSLEFDQRNQSRAIILRLEAWLDSTDGEIKWHWILPKFPETGFEKQKELSRSQHRALGYFRIRPAITAGAFTFGQYSSLGRHLRKLQYMLGKLPEGLRGKSTLPVCLIDNPKCGQCTYREDCLPNSESEGGGEESGTEDVVPIGMALSKIVTGAKTMLGTHGWNQMGASLGPRYGGMRSSLTAITIGLRTENTGNTGFIPFERLSAGEKYALSFSLAKAQVPGDSPPVILVEEPETALYQSALAKLMGDLQATPSGDIPQVIVSSHSEGVLRCFSTKDVFILDRERVPARVEDVIKAQQPGKELVSRLETLIMPGGPSALFADKVLIVEGAKDTLVSGQLDRLAARTAAENQAENYKSFASLGWCVFEAAKADNALKFVRLFQAFGKKVVVLFDGDGPGKASAGDTKVLCPTFIYKSKDGGQPELEEALLKGLPEDARAKTLEDYFGDTACQACNKNGRSCWKEKGGSCYLGDKTARKEQIQSLCINKYFELKSFPPAFKSLLAEIETAPSGQVHELVIESANGE